MPQLSLLYAAVAAPMPGTPIMADAPMMADSPTEADSPTMSESPTMAGVPTMAEGPVADAAAALGDNCPTTIATILNGTTTLTRLLYYAQKTSLLSTLQDPTTAVMVLAPTNAALRTLTPPVLEQLEKDPTKFSAVRAYTLRSGSCM
jgi:hypothetical protein